MNPTGLTQKDAEEKLKSYGYNEITELNKVSALKILLRQIKKNFMIYLLFAAAVMSLFVGKLTTGYTIFGIIILLVVIGFIQEFKAETAVKALKHMITHTSIAIRNGKETEIPSREIVPGDILVLRTGEKIPADCLILEEKELRINESILTGESQEIKKYKTASEKNYNHNNQAFMGTNIANGKCIARVLHTGMNTEFGKIAGMISKAEKELPLQKKVNDIATYMAFIAIMVSALTGGIMLIQNLPLTYDLIINVLIVVIALCVSAFPEGMPVVLISVLASGAYKMAKKNAIVSRMSIIETLGETTVICTDKTGTITKGEMTVKKIFADDAFFGVTGVGYDSTGKFLQNNKEINPKKNVVLNLLLKTAVLCNDAKIERKGTDSAYNIIGSPTEAALLVMSAKSGIFMEDLQSMRKEENSFNSERKMMSVLCEEEREKYIYSKGAPEILINQCTYIQKRKKIIKLTKKEKEKILNLGKELASKRFRVLAIAYKPAKSFKKDGFEKDMIFLGLVSLEDSPRDEIKEAIKSCKSAGIDVKMITGDNKETSVEIGREIGLKGEIIIGDELDKLTDDELAKIVNKTTIFARVKPGHKLRIVKALKKNGEIVTMTGDGVNDAPALKEAHIGVAMGVNGTDVSRESADLVLKDDNFATMVLAVKEGRTIFINIQKAVSYMLSCNHAELFVIFFGILFGLPLPLIALQILFINLVTDDLTALTLGFNQSPSWIMNTKPRRKSGILDKKSTRIFAISGLIIGVGTLGIFYSTYTSLLFQGVAEELAVSTARTMALVTLILFEIANAFNFRSYRTPVFKASLFTNKYLVYASGLAIFAILLILYTPLNIMFETVPLNPGNWVIASLTAFSLIVIFDFLKLMNNWKKIF
ncbi:MAG: cation transporter [Candidatus Aenigmatarchaeota archaeon]|nr:MAG: cation transporter [Candidatus Aenigmarchaeota archaeon]